MSVAAKKSDLTGRVAVAVPLVLVAGLCLSSTIAWNALMFIAVLAVFLELASAGFRASGHWPEAVCTAELWLLGGGLIASQQIRMAPDGVAWLLMVMFGVIATDVGAYFGGRKFGRAGTFFPRLSPNKSEMGAAIGVVSGICVGLTAVLLLRLPIDIATLVAITTPVVAIAGDLLESGTKRLCGIKDFTIAGRSIPGPHGGVADRIDALATAWLCAWLILALSNHL